MRGFTVLTKIHQLWHADSFQPRRGRASKDVESRVANAWSKWRELTGGICDKKVPTKMKLRLIYQTMIRPMFLYGCETWPMSVDGNNRDENGSMDNGASLLEQWRN